MDSDPSVTSEPNPLTTALWGLRWDPDAQYFGDKLRGELRRMGYEVVAAGEVAREYNRGYANGYDRGLETGLHDDTNY